MSDIVTQSVRDVEACGTLAADFAPKVFPDIAAMTRDEMALILHGLACKVQIIESQWENRSSYAAHAGIKSECPRITSLFAALEDYRHLAFAEDCRVMWERAIGNKGGEAGSVYVIEFADGHIKIGKSITPAARVKSVAAGNQARMLRSWVSARVPAPGAFERAAHEHFRDGRVGGEFFTTGFDEAVTWVGQSIEGNPSC